MKKIPGFIQDLLPEGILKDAGEKYFHHLPDVQFDPLNPDSLIHDSEHSWTEYLVAYSLLYPWIVIVLALLGGVSLGTYYWFCKHREHTHRIRCGNCGIWMSPCGLHCPKCAWHNPHPCGVNWIGYAKLRQHITPAHYECHQEVLRTFRRCYYCAQHLHEATPLQVCPACGNAVIQHKTTITDYNNYIKRRRTWTIVSVVFLGVIPIIGPLFASSLYKRTLINPYALYMNIFRESFVMVVLVLCRHLFRLIPFIGMVGMPILCITEYHLYRKLFVWKSQSREHKKLAKSEIVH